MTVAERVRLMLVSDRRRLRGDDLARIAREAAAAGLDDLQIREKDLGGRALADLVRAVRDAVAGTPARIVVNGRVDVAVAARVQAVQLPENGLAVSAVKSKFPRLAVGASRHTAEGARQAEAEGADFVVLGPVFATPGKEGLVIGLAGLEQAVRAVRVPVYAIGGIEAGNARAAVEAGARGLALLRPFLSGSPAAVIAGIEAVLA